MFFTTDETPTSSFVPVLIVILSQMKWNAVPGAEKYIILIKKADKWINMRKTNLFFSKIPSKNVLKSAHRVVS